MSAFLIWVRLVPKWVWVALLGVSLLSGLYLVGYSKGKASQEAETAKVQAEFNAYKKEVQKAVSIRLTQNKIKEAQDRAVFAQIATQYAKDIKDAQAKSDSVIAGLRAGTLKLRKQWQGCSTAAQGSGNTSGVDESARLRETGSGNLVRIGAKADAQVKGLQNGWLQCEKRYEP